MTRFGRTTAFCLCVAIQSLAQPVFAGPPTPPPTTTTKPTGPKPPGPAEPVIIMDLRKPASDGDVARFAETRAALARALSVTDAGPVTVRSTAGSEQDLALAGALRTSLEIDRQRAEQALARAAAAFGDLDCAAAKSAAHDTVLAFASLRAAEPPVGLAGGPAPDPAPALALGQAHVYELLCAHTEGDTDAAIAARTQLERLGVTQAPKGVSAMVWALYPALDASTTRVAEVEITSAPAGAGIWVDHVRSGSTPGKVLLTLGPHIVAVGSGSRHQAVDVRIDRDGQTIHLSLPEVASAPQQYNVMLSQRVARWKTGGKPPTAAEIATILRHFDVRFGLVLTGAGDAVLPVEIWALGPGEREARLLGVEPADRVSKVATTVRARANKWDGTGPDPNIELLREPKNVRTDGKGKKKAKLEWWAYATIIGALTLGTTVILANDLADDRQRIELTWPRE